MIGLDTNLLVRDLVQDDAAQAKLASAAIESAAGRGERLRLSAVTLCELVWVLESAYDQTRAALIGLVNDAAGCEYTLTFGRSLRRMPHFKVI